jgi:NADPH:quinone reductase-like Zn-dependent oxidoreductase
MATEKMLCVAISDYAEPSAYEMHKLTIPPLVEPTDVQIKVHAASINPIDLKKASGVFKSAFSDQHVDSSPRKASLTSADSPTRLATTAQAL